MIKKAPADYPLHELIQNRWSPRAFSQQPISTDHLHILFEAARWAPSSNNEQPWLFVYASKEEPAEFETILHCLKESNQFWARTAPVLVITAAKTLFDQNGKPNRHAWYDVGQAISYLTLQAMALGIYCHQMGGFFPALAQKTLNIPADYEPVTAIALGYPGDLVILSDELRIRETAPRFRRKQTEFVFRGQYKK